MTETPQQLFDRAKKIVFLTGAGVSTPSGIPDYRSRDGLYTENHNAEYYLSHEFMDSHPQDFYDYVTKNLFHPDAQPNVIHEKQAALTQQNRATIITQNIDNLYDKAQAAHLIEFHGNLYRTYCRVCGKQVPWQTYLKSPIHDEDGGQLRSDCVLYGENLSEQNITDSVRAIEASDLIVIVGTSMRVYPFARLVDYRSPETPVLMINEEVIELPFKTMQINEEATQFFSQLSI